jgi:hypothetical protein
MEDKSHRKSTVKSKWLQFTLIRIIALISLCITLLFFCYCSKIVDISIPPDEVGGVSAQGTCVACHSTEEMITLVAKEIPPAEEGGEG